MSSAVHALAGREVFLRPGELGYGGANAVLGTLLGSCVAITLWHPQRRIGSLCHFILPAPSQRARADGRFGCSAFAQMYATLARHGVPPQQCIAKIFGGAAMLHNSQVHDVGARNITMARSMLHQAGLTAAVEDVGGSRCRRLYFDILSGDVWIRYDYPEDLPAGA